MAASWTAAGLLLLIRKHIDPLLPGELIEIRSREISVGEELPAWCRMTGNQLVSQLRRGVEQSFLVSRGPFREIPAAGSEAPAPRADERDRNIAAQAHAEDSVLPQPAVVQDDDCFGLACELSVSAC